MEHEGHEAREEKPRGGLVRVDEQREKLATEVIGAAIEVHRVLGPGHLESVYERALCAELTLRGIRFRRQVVFKVDYKGHVVGEGRVDMFAEEMLVVENKAVASVTDVDRQIVVFYLKNLEQPLGLILNFNLRLMKEGIHRVIRTKT